MEVLIEDKDLKLRVRVTPRAINAYFKHRVCNEYVTLINPDLRSSSSEPLLPSLMRKLILKCLKHINKCNYIDKVYLDSHITECVFRCDFFSQI